VGCADVANPLANMTKALLAASVVPPQPMQLIKPANLDEKLRCLVWEDQEISIQLSGNKLVRS